MVIQMQRQRLMDWLKLMVRQMLRQMQMVM
jgi:hypothetical protein